MNILVLGSGGREHAILSKLYRDNHSINQQLFCIPGNAGTATISQNVDISLDDQQMILSFAVKNNIQLTIVGQECLLADGIVDLFHEHNLRIFGPNKLAARLESSKIFARDLMKKYNIPHPRYVSCSNKHEIELARNSFG